MAKNINLILKEVLEEVKPSEEEAREIEKAVKSHLEKVEARIRKRKINAQVFIGGSAAKRTMIKKDGYDIDVFIRFDKRYKNELLSDLTEKILEGLKKERVHGSRDYFKAKISENLSLEFVPVKKISNPREAENITDLSYSHVNYIRKKVKSEKLLNEIRLAKAFCYANGAYGAESYVQGFSGYGLELLIAHYGSFLKFIKTIAKMKVKDNNKIIIDIEKHHKNKSHVLLDINAAKLQSPIILVDPTYKQRNVLAALSEETLREFQKACKNFLRKPSVDFFAQKIINIEKLKADADSRSYEFILLGLKTDKQAGDIAGSKLLKFYNHLNSELEKFFEIKARGFEYGKGQTARVFFVAEAKKEIIVTGPLVTQEKHTKMFRNMHNNISVKNGRLYSKFKPKFTLETFVRGWVAKNRRKMIEMGVTNFGILG